MNTRSCRCEKDETGNKCKNFVGLGADLIISEEKAETDFSERGKGFRRTPERSTRKVGGAAIRTRSVVDEGKKKAG